MADLASNVKAVIAQQFDVSIDMVWSFIFMYHPEINTEIYIHR